MTRFPGSVYGVGTEPDARFTFANERTFLAWIRSALALLAAAVALVALDLPMARVLQLAASALLFAGGIALPLLAWRGWAMAERALRRGQALPSTIVLLPLALLLVVAAVLIAVGFALHD